MSFKKVLLRYLKGALGGGAILLTFSHSLIQHNFDFSDDACRCLVVVGVPYPSMKDPVSLLK